MRAPHRTHLADHRVTDRCRYLALVHSEDFDDVQLGVAHMLALATAAPQKLRKRYESLVRVARQHAEVLSRFARYPHRNTILGRTTTPEEAEFMSTSRYGFMASVVPPAERGSAKRAAERRASKRDKKGRRVPDGVMGTVTVAERRRVRTTSAPQRILLLHSFRQVRISCAAAVGQT